MAVSSLRAVCVALAAVSSVPALAAPSIYDQLTADFADSSKTELPTPADIMGWYSGRCYVGQNGFGQPVDPNVPSGALLVVDSFSNGPIFPKRPFILLDQGGEPTEYDQLSADQIAGISSGFSATLPQWSDLGVDQQAQSLLMTSSDDERYYQLRVRRYTSTGYLIATWYDGLQGSYYPQYSDVMASCYFYLKVK